MNLNKNIIAIDQPYRTDLGEQVDGTNIPDTPKKSRRAKSQLDFIDCICLSQILHASQYAEVCYIFIIFSQYLLNLIPRAQLFHLRNLCKHVLDIWTDASTKFRSGNFAPKLVACCGQNQDQYLCLISHFNWLVKDCPEIWWSTVSPNIKSSWITIKMTIFSGILEIPEYFLIDFSL